MSATTTVEVKGTIEFHFAVTNWDFARQLDQLLTKNAASIAQPAAAAKRIQDSNGRAAKRGIHNPETKEQVLKLLKEKYASKPFTTSEANKLIKTALGVSSNTVRRSLKLGLEKGTLQADGKGVWHFLALATIPA